MNIRELDEYQGLTTEMVREWLRKNSYRLAVSDAPGEVWNGVQGRPVVLYLDGSELAGAIERIAAIEKRSIQAVLRDVNPRMRKGMPSEAARAAHDGFWLAHKNGVPLQVGIFEGSDQCLRLVVRQGEGGHGQSLFPGYRPGVIYSLVARDGWSFWPCDAHSSKCRWPEKDGVML